MILYFYFILIFQVICKKYEMGFNILNINEYENANGSEEYMAD